MCIVPEHYPKNSFFINMLLKIEEITGWDEKHGELIFDYSKHVPHKMHFPKDHQLVDALGKVVTVIILTYPEEKKRLKKNKKDPLNIIFHDAADETEHTAQCLLVLSQLLFQKNPVLKNLLQMPSLDHFGLKIYRIVLDTVINIFVDFLMTQVASQENYTDDFRIRIKDMEDQVTNHIIENSPVRDLLKEYTALTKPEINTSHPWARFLTKIKS